MSDTTSPIPTHANAQPEAPVAPDMRLNIGAKSESPIHFGEHLRVAREACGLTTTDLSQRLRLSVRQIETLERGDLKKLPELSYVRGFVRAYAREVHLDPELALTDLHARAVPDAPVGVVDALQVEPSRRGVGAGSRVIVGFIVALLVLAGGLGFWHKHRQQAVSAAAVTPVAAVPVPANPAAPDNAGTPVAPAPANGMASAAVATPSQALPAPVVTPKSSQLKLHVHASAWVEVRDKTGQAVFSEMVHPSHDVSVQVSRPFDLTIGNAPKVDATLDEQVLPLSGHTTENGVARLHLQ